MSALGQKQTYALQKAMSALPPIATAKANFCKGSCPLYPRKRTCAVRQCMSALGQKRTLVRLTLMVAQLRGTSPHGQELSLIPGPACYR
jgi:hypothetical protein